MRYNVTDSFRVASSVKEELPWGGGIVFTIRWSGNSEYQSFLEKNRSDAEFTEKMRQLQYKAYAEAEARAGKRRGKERKTFVEEYAQDAFASLLRDADMGASPEGVSDEGVVCHLVAHVEGLYNADTGEPIDWSKESGLDLLSQTDPIPDDVHIADPYGDDDFECEAGTPIGRAIKFWTIWVAGQAARFREAQLEAAAKN